MQRATNCRSKDLTFEVPFLQSLRSHDNIVRLCKVLATTNHGGRLVWVLGFSHHMFI